MSKQLLNISPELSLPIQAVTETLGILAIKRVGKSNAGVVMAEEMYDAGLPWVAIDPKGDWWGVRAAADGKGKGLPVIVFGGEHGDVPLEETSGRLIADLVVDQRLTCVLDISGLMDTNKSAARRFLTDFAERLYARNREPLHVFCEEADEYIPQLVTKETAKVVSAFERLVKRGGFRGIGITLITQRSASLNKDVLTQIGTLIVLQTTSPQDRDAILRWVKHHALGQELVDGLPELAKGEAWVFSPAWLRILKKITFRRRRTFDSGSTPEVGVKARPPATLADVDIASLRVQMASTIEKARADDPRELRKRIAELERERREYEMHKTAHKTTPEIREARVEVPVFDTRVVIDIQDAVERWMQARSKAVDDELATMLRGLDDVVRKATHGARSRTPSKNLLQGQVAKPAVGAGAGSERTSRSGAPAVESRPAPPAARSNGHSDKGTDIIGGEVTRPQQRILDSLAWYESVGIAAANRNQLALLSNYTPNTGTFNNYLGALRTSDLVDYPSPGYVGLTAGGRAAASPVDITPTSEAMHQVLYGKLGGPRARILAALIAAYPNALSREVLAELTQYTVNTGTFNNYLGSLRSLQLIDYPHKGSVVALAVLFLEEAARR